jgi:hypothetical protein
MSCDKLIEAIVFAVTAVNIKFGQHIIARGVTLIHRLGEQEQCAYEKESK